ncbi:MAG: hypothetical protein KC435_10870 [Thermomicrobiales bacterium]|nr:hypothetical protein [Thermomicrobiales bacterium]
MEYSIPAAGKNPANDGYADIVALTTQYIWEIKPAHLAADAVKEAKFYVEKARAVCGLGWKAGMKYQPAGRYKDDPNVVFQTPKIGGVCAELYAWQPEGPGGAGAVLYAWRMRGRKKQELSAYELFWARRTIAETYFPARSIPVRANDPNGPQIDTGLLTPRMDDGHPAFAPLADRLLAAGAVSLPRYVEGGAYQISVERAIFDKVVNAASRSAGEDRIRQLKANTRVFPDAVKRTTTISLMLGTIWVGGTIGAAIAAVGEYVMIPATIGAVKAPVIASAGATVIRLSPLAAKAVTSTAIAAGSLLMFVPKDSLAQSAGQPINASVVRFDILNPAQAREARVGHISDYDGGEWVTIALIGYN